MTQNILEEMLGVMIYKKKMLGVMLKPGFVQQARNNDQVFFFRFLLLYRSHPPNVTRRFIFYFLYFFSGHNPRSLSTLERWSCNALQGCHSHTSKCHPPTQKNKMLLKAQAPQNATMIIVVKVWPHYSQNKSMRSI